MREFHYRIGWRVSGHRPGFHRSTGAGPGFEFQGHAALFDLPDARKLDLHATLRDPSGLWQVRVHRQRASIPVILLADLSASMGALTGAGGAGKMQVLADFTASLAYSAHRTGDTFAFIGCDEVMRDDYLLSSTRVQGAGIALAEKLRAAQPTGRNAIALFDAAAALTERRSLVFLASDFHFPLSLLEQILRALARHEVVPVVIWDKAELQPVTRFGLATIRDSESGGRRTLLLRKKLRERINAAYLARRAELSAAFIRHALRPVYFSGDFDADKMTAHFHGALATTA
ncbi:MAG: hypothetical protein M3Q32_01145 [Pseudomonadota bacterium]|nr:hypothetical protein [Burkholderiales bacterium]MDQ3195002.1 hypothetical protein [Pseudomonadota bacterium]